MVSRIDCKHIHHPNCECYEEGRFCPETCKGFYSINPIIPESYNEETIIKEPIIITKASKK